MHSSPTTAAGMTALSLLLLLLLLSLLSAAAADIAGDRKALLAFQGLVTHSRRLQWPPSVPTCEWIGVTCDAGNSSVLFLRLPGLALRGNFPPNTLSLLLSLRVLSLRSNFLYGPLPDLSTLRSLRALYLHRNLFSSHLPASFSRLRQLQRLDLSRNNLSGVIPPSLSNLTRLSALYLSNNTFVGAIPDFRFPNLVNFSVAYNDLNGSIPTSLSKFPATSFVGNPHLCGLPLPPCPSPPASPPISSPSKKERLSRNDIIAIAVAAAAVFLGVLLLLACCLVRRRRAGGNAEGPKSPEATRRSPEGVGTGTTSSAGGPERSRLVFVGGGSFGFDLEDLLRASAEVLGKGSTGTSYKAVLEDGATTVVVKRLRDVTASKREFDARMDAIGRLRHRNLAPLRAYYFSKDEKLLVTDYLPGGSLSASLHGARGTGLAPLDWHTRLRVALATARGIAHLHADAGIVHGNLKASNVLLRLDPEASVLTDFGLSPMYGGGAAAPASSRAAGYRAPEVVQTRKPTVKSDVYSYGVVLLELLTGKAPQFAAVGEEGLDLPRWVQSVVREEWTAEVFDADMVGYGGEAVEEEMVQLLQVALACVALLPDARPEMTEVLRMVGEIAEKAAAREAGLKPSSEEEPAAPTVLDA